MELGVFRDATAKKWGLEYDRAALVLIENFIIAGRATIIQRRYDSTKIFPVSLIERVTCEDLIQVEDNECSCGCNGIKSVRTLRKVPNPLIVKDDSYFTFVGRGTTSFSYVPFHQVQEIKYRRFSDNIIYYSYLDGYVYFINANALKEADFAYVPENLLDFLKFGRCKTSNCIDKGKVYIEDSLVEGIKLLLDTARPSIENTKGTEITLDE